jgi:uncharacterized protein
MSLNKLFVIFGIILVIFAGIVFFQFRSRSADSTTNTPKSTVKINNRTFNVEVASTPDKQQQGLSGKSSLPQDQGMLFVFEDPEYHTFWMKNMKFPIDIIFIKDDVVISIAKNAKPADSSDENLQLYRSKEPVNRVLEINAGLVDKYEIKEGDKIEIKLNN